MLARHIYKSFSKQKPCFIHHRNAKIKGNSTVVDYFDTEKEEKNIRVVTKSDNKGFLNLLSELVT